jgi:hypothetical protein
MPSGQRKGLSARDPEIAFMYVAKISQAADGFDKAHRCGHHDVEVDDRLGGETGNRRAPDVLDTTVPTSRGAFIP